MVRMVGFDFGFVFLDKSPYVHGSEGTWKAHLDYVFQCNKYQDMTTRLSHTSYHAVYIICQANGEGNCCCP